MTKLYGPPGPNCLDFLTKLPRPPRLLWPHGPPWPWPLNTWKMETILITWAIIFWCHIDQLDRNNQEKQNINCSSNTSAPGTPEPVNPTIIKSHLSNLFWLLEKIKKDHKLFSYLITSSQDPKFFSWHRN